VKAAVATALAMWLANRIGLESSYWAGISAIVATGGTLGASLRAAISRISATMVGLALGLAAFALPVNGILVGAATVFVALIVMPVMSLDAGTRLGAASTLIVTALPAHSAVGDALARGATVPLGCAVAVVVGLVVVPHRAADHLRSALRADVGRAGELAGAALLSYVGVSPAADLERHLGELEATSAAHATALRDATSEPGERGERLLRLQRRVAAVDHLVEHVGALVATVSAAAADQAPSLVRAELSAVAEHLGEAARAAAEASDTGALPEQLSRVREALAVVDASFANIRERRATVDFSTDEVTRLLTVLRLTHEMASALSVLAA
jgi:Fusaric acid resistance protein family